MISAGRVLIMPKGDYNPSVTYEMLDLVSYNGSSYIAKGTTTGNLPTNTTYWQLSAYGGQASNVAGNFAEIEVSDVASRIHYVDDVFVDKDSRLMKATQTINVGDTIDENVNCTPTTVEALISYLSSYVDSLDSLNKKIQGAIEIAAQTDLHSLALGEYYKKQTTFYVTNAPVGINQVPAAVFRLTVEAALDNASQASSPLLLTLRTPDGKIYTQGFDGTSWGSWEQIAVESSVADVDTRVDSVESSVADVETSSIASKSYAIGESFYYNDVLCKATVPISQGGTITPGTNCTPEKIIEKIDDLVSENQTLTNEVSDISDEIADMNNVLGAKNLLSNDAVSQTIDGLSFTVNSDNSIGISGTNTGSAGAYSVSNEFLLKKGSYKLSRGTHSTPCPSLFIVKASDSSTIAELTINSSTEDVEFTLDADVNVKCYMWYVANEAYNTTFYPMIRPASIKDATYEPYSMTNREMTPYVQAISNPNLLDNPWFTVNQRGQSSYTTDNAYAIDRWKKDGGTVQVSDGITLTSTQNGNGLIQQFIDNSVAELLLGKTITVSVLLSNGDIYKRTGTVPISLPSTSTNVASVPYPNAKYSGLYVNSTSSLKMWFNIGIESGEKSVSIRAVKLELGSVSTLAQDTAPNYTTELMKCQRYFVRIDNTSGGVALGTAVALNDDRANICIRLPIAMRAKPTPSNYTDLQVVNGVQTLSVSSIASSSHDNGYETLNAVTTGSTQGTSYLVRLASSGHVDFSADL